jgi:hypothetical protein
MTVTFIARRICTSILLISHLHYIETYQCHQCNAMIYNYPVTIDTLPSPTEDDCDIVMAIRGCSIHVEWYADGTSEVYYRLDPPFPFDSVLAIIERESNIETGQYTTKKSISYNCRSLTAPCNTIDHLKRAILSIKFPHHEQMKQFDRSISISTTAFDRSRCYPMSFSNGTQCSTYETNKLEQYIGIADYRQTTHMCTICSNVRPMSANFFDYSTTFLCNNRTRTDRISVACQTCSPMDTIDRIRHSFKIEMDFDRFFRSNATSMNVSLGLYLLLSFMSISMSHEKIIH